MVAEKLGWKGGYFTPLLGWVRGEMVLVALSVRGELGFPPPRE
jgi:hypothetical protein